MNLELWIPGQPFPQGRARVGSRGTYYADKSGPWRMTVQDALRPHRIAFPSERVWVSMVFHLDNSAKGDLDNYCKAVLDAANKYLYTDDKQVYQLHASRQDSRRTGLFLNAGAITDENTGPRFEVS